MPLFAGIGSPQANAAASGGKVYAYNNISNVASRVVANANPQRVSITFHNPGTIDIYIAPVNVQNVIGTAPAGGGGSNAALAPTTAALGGCWRVFGNGGILTISGECQGAWQALADSATTNALTVMESNV